MKPKQNFDFRPADQAERLAFRRACDEVVLSCSPSDGGVGTLAEKMLHQTVKLFLCPDSDDHEVGVVDTRFVADAKIGNTVFEVQTGHFSPMKKKIAHYLNETNFTVCVVHPIAYKRWLSTIDPITHTISPKKRSAGVHSPDAFLSELYSLLPLFPNPRLQIRLLFLEVHDFKYSSIGRRRRGIPKKVERVPLELLGTLDFSSADHYRIFLPDTLPNRFSVKEYSEETGIRGIHAYSAVRVLTSLGLLRQVEDSRPMAFEKVL